MENVQGDNGYFLPGNRYGKYLISMLLLSKLEPQLEIQVRKIFLVTSAKLEKGLKYLAFYLKPNDYKVKCWNWIYEIIKGKLINWYHRLLSRGRHANLN